MEKVDLIGLMRATLWLLFLANILEFRKFGRSSNDRFGSLADLLHPSTVMSAFGGKAVTRILESYDDSPLNALCAFKNQATF
jgi:hypothetical protein